MPTEADLIRMRRTVESKLPDTVEVLTPVTTAAPAGGRTESWDGATSVTIRGLVLPASAPGEKSEGGKQVTEARWIVRLPHGTAITSRNRLRANGVTYQVLSFTGTETFATSVDCVCRTL